MRILFLSTWFPYPPDNGSKIRAYQLLRAIATSHEVTLVAPSPPDNRGGGKLAASELGVRDLYPVPVDPFRYVQAPWLARFSSPIPLAYWPSRLMQQVVGKTAALRTWDVVVAFQAYVARYSMQLRNTPRVLDMDTSLSCQMHERHASQDRLLARWRTWVSWQKAQRYETRLFRRLQACTVVSPLELDFVGAMAHGSGCRMELSPNGVDCQHHHPGLAQPQPGKLVYNGALTYAANYDAMQHFLAEIYPLIQARAPGVSLTITGTTAGVDRSALALNGSVCLSGYVDDIRLPVAEASVCVIPIRQGGGTRLKILEAMALGTPVVSTTKGAEGLGVTPGKDILIADEPNDFAAQVVHLLQDFALRQQLAENARRLVEEHYDWSEIGRRFVDLVEEIAGQRVEGQPAR